MKRLFLLTIMVATVFIFSGCKNDEEETIRPVEYIEVHKGGEIVKKPFFGYLKSSSLTDLSFQIEGALKKIYVNEGQTVRKGQIIAELDAPLYQIQVHEAKYNLSDAIIKYENAKSYYDRIKKLHAAGGISDNDMDNARTKMESAGYQIQVAQERLSYSSRRSGYDRIEAPTDGIILSKTATEQQYLTPGTSVVKFQSTGDIDAYIFVSQNYINRLSPGQKAKVKIDAIKDTEFDAYIKEMSATSLESLSYRVKLKLIDQSADFKDGMSASAVFQIIPFHASKIKIPVNSVLKEGNSNIVYTITDANNGIGTIKKNNVELGELEGDYINVIYGINDGDFVITKGVSEVQEGQKVKF